MRAPRCSRCATGSLDAMAAGGIYDQVGGGFHRYSVDAHWLVPHFEKMLYDQALLDACLPARLDGHRSRALPRRSSRRPSPTSCATCATPTAASSRPRMPTPRASRASSTCGRSRSSRRCAATHFPTWCATSASPRGQLRGSRTPGSAATSSTRSARPRTARRRSTTVLPVLFAAREQRVRPGLDDKVLLGWNALFLRSLVEAAHALQRDDWMDAARANARLPAARAAPRRRAAAAVVAGRPRQPRSRTPRTTPRCSRRCSRWPSSTTCVAGRGARRRRRPRRPLRRRRTRRLLHHRQPTPKRSSSGPRTSRTTRPRRRTRSPPTACSASSALTGDRRRRASGPSGGWPPWRRSLGEHPTAFAFLLEALERVVAPAARGRDRGRRRRRRATRSSTCCAPGCSRGRCGSPRAPGVGADLTPLLADRDARRRTACGLRVRALRVPAAGHRPRGAARAARRLDGRRADPRAPAAQREHRTDQQQHGHRRTQRERRGRRDTGSDADPATVRPLPTRLAARARPSVAWSARRSRRGGRQRGDVAVEVLADQRRHRRLTRRREVDRVAYTSSGWAATSAFQSTTSRFG